MSKVLIKFNGNYADEFDVSGFVIMEEKDFYDKLKMLEQWPIRDEDELHSWEKNKDKVFYRPMYIGFGTNESVEFDGLEDFKSQIRVEELTEEEAEFLQKRLIVYQYSNSYSFGSIVESVFEQFEEYLETKDDG